MLPYGVSCGDGSTPYADSALSPCFHDCLAFCHRHEPPQSPPSRPLNLSTVNSSPCPGIPPQSLNSSSQLLHLPGDLRPYPGYVWLRQELSDSHSIQAAIDQLLHSQTYMFRLWLRQFPLCGDQTSASFFPPAKGRSSATNTPVFALVPLSLPGFVWFYIFFSAG